ncbi:unnamed protein product [Urochloa humidicola]
METGAPLLAIATGAVGGWAPSSYASRRAQGVWRSRSSTLRRRSRDGGRLRARVEPEEDGRRRCGEDSSAVARRRPATRRSARRSSGSPPARARRLLNAATESAGTPAAGLGPGQDVAPRRSPRSPAWRGGRSHEQIWAGRQRVGRWRRNIRVRGDDAGNGAVRPWTRARVGRNPPPRGFGTRRGRQTLSGLGQGRSLGPLPVALRVAVGGQLGAAGCSHHRRQQPGHGAGDSSAPVVDAPRHVQPYAGQLWSPPTAACLAARPLLASYEVQPCAMSTSTSLAVGGAAEEENEEQAAERRA